MKHRLPKYEWVLRESDPDASLAKVNSLQSELGYSKLLLRVLVSRDIDTPEKIRAFLNPSLSGILPPEAIPNIARARDRLVKACREKEAVLVHGDYDVDGIVGAVILHKTLKDLGCKSRIFLPRRDADGFGLSLNAVELAKKSGIGLIVSVDCGISSNDSVKAANDAGIEVIITDHHAIPDIPPADAILVHPDLDGAYPGGKIAGATVGFKLAMSLLEAMGHDLDEAMERLLPLVALATIGDICPLTGENRVIVKFGLDGIPTSGIPGLKVLYQGTLRDGNARPISVRDVGFGMAPLMNAAGRLGDPLPASKLLLAKDADSAWVHFRKLDGLNRQRKKIMAGVVDRLSRLPEVAWTKGGAGILALMDQDCIPGIAGLAAIRLAEITGRPTCVLAPSESIDGPIYRGSMRTIGGEDLLELMQPASEFASRFGGHPGAIGITVAPENLGKFIKACEKIEWEPVPKRKTLDLAVDAALTSPKEVEELNLMQPCGEGNPEPEFVWGPVHIEKTRAVGKELDHLQFTFVTNDGGYVKGIGFSMAQYFRDSDSRGRKFLTAGQFIINNWMGNQSVEFQVSDLEQVK
ncbi:MAG: single-stranded-DNA-specific exonuclease RecJ [bacterium]|nr:single-stranded-DNA-specific exonuclease RecJ [bacterium]